MRRVLLGSVVVGLAVLFAAGSWAGTQAGKSELRVDGSLQNLSVDSYETTLLTAQLVYNRFLSDQFSIGVSVRPSEQTQSTDGDEESTTSTLFFLGRGDIYLASGESSFSPYIGGHAGMVNYQYDNGDDSTSESVATYGVQGGGKIFVSENTSFNVEVDLSIYTPETEEEDSEDSEDVTVTSLMIGYSVYF